jgi:hypothetical protein
MEKIKYSIFLLLTKFNKQNNLNILSKSILRAQKENTSM